MKARRFFYNQCEVNKNTFDNIAWIYDSLAWVVFRGNIRKAQLHFLSSIKPDSKVLVIGGGTGWLLDELDGFGKLMIIDYVEASGKMLELSKSKQPFENIEVNFIHGTHEKIAVNSSYDVVITNFFLDVFKADSLHLVMDKLDSHLKNDGQWIMTDFVNTEKFWQKLLIRLMYTFFRISSNLEGSKLLDFDLYFKKKGLNLIEQKNSFYGMIVSRIYGKSIL